MTVEEIPETVTEEETEAPADEEPDEADVEEPVVETPAAETVVVNEAAGTQLTAEETDPADATEEPVETTVQLYPNMFTFGEDQVSGTYTVTVPAGEIYNFELYNAGGMLLSIDGGEAVAMTGNMMMPDTFSIANEGTEAAEHTLTLSHPVGSMMNPEVLTELSYIDVTLAEGDYDGYYYTYTAPGAGTATFYIGSITEGVVGDIILYNENTYAQKSLLNDGVDNWGLEVTIDVNEGDVLSIQVIANEDAEGNQYPAAEVSWAGSFAYVPGSRMNPIAPDLIWNADWTKADAEVSVAAGATTWFIINNGVYVVTVDGAEVEVEAAVSPYGFASTVFSITNDTEEDKTYAITVDYPVGTRENPEVIEDIDYGGYAVVPENSFNGYNYIYTAPATGYISVSIGWITEGVEGDLILNNRNSYENKSLSADAVNGIVTMAITEGDVIDIQAVALPDASYNYPAADISWTGKFSEVAPGAETNPVDITGLLSWNEQYTEAAATVTVPVGTTYFAVNRVSGMLLSIDGAEGIPMGGDFFNPAVFSITNEGEDTAEYSLTFAYPVGTQMNPEVLDGMYGGYAVIEEGNSQGYYYTYTAESTGYLNVGITWITEGVEGDIVLSNENTYQQVTVAADAVNGIATMAVTEGDVIVINAVAMPDANWNYPAAEIGWSGSLTEELPGAESSPIDITTMLSWNEKGNEATASVTVAAGATTYFAVHRVSGMLLSINDGEATIMGGDFFNPAVFSITNDGESAAVYSLVFTYPVGDYMNPEFLYYTRYIQANLAEGDQDGYYYTYIAQEEGTVVLTGEAIEGVDYDVIIVNNNSWEQAWMSDSSDYTVSMPVMPGDELTIQVVVSPDENRNIPAATVILYGSFIYPVGHMMNPDELTLGTTSVDIKAESQGYFYNWTATGNGVLTFKMDTKKGWSYSVSNLYTGIYGDTMVSGDGSATSAVYVNEGDLVQIMVNTYDAENPYVAPEGALKFTTKLISTDLETVSGKTLTLNFYHPETGKKLAASKVNWEITEAYVINPDGETVVFEDVSSYATLKAGKLKTLKNGDQVYLTVKAAPKADEKAVVNYFVTVFPASTKLGAWLEYTCIEDGEAYDHMDPVFGTMIVDVNPSRDQDLDMFPLTLSTVSYPINANAEVKWTVSDKKSAYAEYTVGEDGKLVVSDPTGKTGTVTITAAAQDGSGKKASFKLKFTKLAHSFEIVRKDGKPMEEIPINYSGVWDEELQDIVITEVYESRKGTYAAAGSKLELKAVVDPNASSKGAYWYSGSNYAKISSSGVVTIDKKAPADDLIFIYAYTKDFNIEDEIVIKVTNTATTVAINSLNYEKPGVTHMSNSEVILDVSSVASQEEMPALEFVAHEVNSKGIYQNQLKN